MAHANLGPLPWTYVGLSIVWSALLVAGMAYLWHHRRLPFLQIRRLPLVFVAIILLHLYAVCCMIGLMIGPLAPCDAQFWIMSIYLPFGMALLQAANSQFQYIASRQKKLAKISSLEELGASDKASIAESSGPWWKRTIRRIQAMDHVTKILFWIGIAMIVELALTLFIYFGSEVFHPSYGIFNIQVPGTEQQRMVMCLTGWEWWLSIVWQFFWAWVYAPYLLWQTRNVHDTHGWRIQTICCCIAGLPASPLWLAALYLPQFAPVNAVWIPPQWFALSIFLIEIFTILFPCWQVVKSHKLRDETTAAINAWEERKQQANKDLEQLSASSAGLTAGTTIGRESVIAPSGRTKFSQETRDSRKSDTLTMDAMENALKTNPKPLLEFAALKDFSGENVSFLSHVADWNRAWESARVDSARRRELFILAVRIYSHFVSLEYSEFPVNISSRTAKDLHQVFNRAAILLNRRGSLSDSATPFETITQTVSASASSSEASDLELTLGKANLESVTRVPNLSTDGNLDLPIPDSFDDKVFDSAEKEIKYLVLTNTWPKFVNAGFESASQASRNEDGHRFDFAKKYLCGLDRMV